MGKMLSVGLAQMSAGWRMSKHGVEPVEPDGAIDEHGATGLRAKRRNEYQIELLMIAGLLLVLCAAIGYLFYSVSRFFVRNGSKNLQRNTPEYPGKWPLIGHQIQFMKADANSSLHKLIGDIASQNPSSLVRFQLPLAGISGILDDALFCLPTNGKSDDQWKRHRKQLQPSFGPTFLRFAVEETKQVTRNLFDSWKSMTPAERSNNDIHRYFTCIAVDVIGKIAFSYDFETTKHTNNPSHPCYSSLESVKVQSVNFILTLIQAILGSIAKRFAPPLLWPLINVSVHQLKGHVKVVTSLISKVNAIFLR
ncbi:MAG: hypothetical protein SGCHY_001803 [Lobulomycetales sp.]